MRQSGKMFQHFKKYLKVTQDLDLPSIIKPVYYVTSLFGLFPISIRYRKHKNDYEAIERSLYVNSLCGISFVLVILIFFALHIQEMILASDKATMTEGLMTQLNYILELTTFIVFSLVAYVCAFLNRNVYVKMLNTFITTWMNLPVLKGSQRILHRLRFQIIIVIMWGLVTAFILQICINFTRSDGMWKMILVTVTFVLPQMIQFIFLAFYYALIMMVIALLTNINDQCRQLLGGNDMSLLVQSKNTCSTIRNMELVYIKAFEMKLLINEAFQGPILATTLQCFHSIVSESHIIYHGVISRSATTHDLANCSVWIFYQVLKIYSLAYSGNLLKIEALKIGQTIHRIPTEKQDVRCLVEIQHFATLMSCQGIEISLYGYFPVDATLLYNMLASAMMYLIILVQFDKKE